MSFESMTEDVFAERLKLIREEKGYTQEELGKMVGVSKATISKYENKLNAPKIKHAKALSEAMQVSFNWLIGFSEDRYQIESYKIIDIYNKLSEASKHELYNYGNYLLAKEKNIILTTNDQSDDQGK